MYKYVMYIFLGGDIICMYSTPHGVVGIKRISWQKFIKEW